MVFESFTNQLPMESLAEKTQKITPFIENQSDNFSVRDLVRREKIKNNKIVSNIDYYDELDKTGKHFIVSNVDESSKFTLGLHDCTALAVVGKSKTTGENISILTHQDPDILEKEAELFGAELREKLNIIKEQSEEGSIDLAIAGGLDHSQLDDDSYKKALEFVDSICFEIFNSHPTRIGEPKQPRPERVSDDVFFDTENRRLCLVRP